MRTRILDHIDLRVKDLACAREFYGKLLPALGFTCDRSDAKYGTFYSVGGDKPSAFFAFEQDRQHQPNATRIAFWGETRAEVYFDRGHRGLYATDASLYQIDPLGVVVPRPTVPDWSR